MSRVFICRTSGCGTTQTQQSDSPNGALTSNPPTPPFRRRSCLCNNSCHLLQTSMRPTMQPYSFGMLFLREYYLSETRFCSAVVLARHELAPTTRSRKLLSHTLNVAQNRLRQLSEAGSYFAQHIRGCGAPLSCTAYKMNIDVSIDLWYDNRSSG